MYTIDFRDSREYGIAVEKRLVPQTFGSNRARVAYSIVTEKRIGVDVPCPTTRTFVANTFAFTTASCSCPPFTVTTKEVGRPHGFVDGPIQKLKPYDPGAGAENLNLIMPVAPGMLFCWESPTMKTAKPHIEPFRFTGYHIKLSCWHSFECSAEDVEGDHLFIGKSVQCGKCLEGEAEALTTATPVAESAEVK